MHIGKIMKIAGTNKRKFNSGPFGEPANPATCEPVVANDRK
jgi:hypothetical protein